MSHWIRASAWRVVVLMLGVLVLSDAAPWLHSHTVSAAQLKSHATITSDKPDYHPGEIVTLTGSAWKPGENVSIVMVVDPLTHGPVTLHATADSAGNFTNSTYVVQFLDRAVTFVVTANGDKNSSANTTFTDSDTTTVTITGNGNVHDNQGSTINCTETNGTQSGTCSNSYASGTGTVIMTATAATGYVFGTWNNSGSPVCTPSTNTCSFTTASGAHTVTIVANFVPAPPTKLVITSVNGGSNPTAGTAFSVVVQSQNANGIASNVVSNTAVSLSLTTGTGTLGGTLAGTITAGTSSVTISGVTYSKAESGVVITATRTSGDVLTAGASAAFTVNKANAAAVAITADTPDPSVTGQPVTVNVSVTPASGVVNPTGTVTVTVTNSAATCNATLTAGNPSTGSCALSPTAVGAQTLTATYTGDTNYNTGTAGTAAHAVNQASTTTTITNAGALATASNAGVAYPVNYSVAVTAPGAGTPTGNVNVSDGTGGTCSGTVAAGTCSLTSTTAGAKTIVATYAGDTNFAGSASAGVAHTVNVSSTTTGLVSSANPSVVGQTVTFTATVAPIPTVGITVTFKDGASTLGTGTTNASGVATFPTSALTIAGNPHSITAVFAGDASYNTSTSSAVTQTINPANTTTTVSAGTLSTATVVGQAYPVAFTVTVNAPGGGTITGSDIVTVSDGVATCTATITVGTCNLTSTSAGTKSITAAFPGDASYNSSTSAGVSHTVNKAATTTTITSSLATATVVGEPYTVTFTVAVTAPGAGTIPGTDTVTVSDGVATCSGTVTAGSCSLTSTTAGAKTVTASFVTDANFAASTSTGVAHTVNKAATTTTITSNLSTATNVGQAYSVAFTVVANAPGAGTPTGTVTVSDGTSTCTATVAVGTCSLTSLTAGAKTITASYPSDANFLASVSAGVAHTVNSANTTTTLVSGTNPSTFGQSVTFTATVAPIPATGSVITFKDGAATIGTGTTNASGVATFATTTLSIAGSPHAITASFPGDANFNASTSNTVNQTVNKATATVAITSANPNPSVTGQAVTVNFSVTPASGAGNPTGSVTITISGSAATCNGALTPGSPSTGTCSITPTAAAASAQTLTATYSGDGNYNSGTTGTTSHTVNKAATTTTITTNLSASTEVNTAYTVAWSTTVTSPGAGTPTGTVTVSDGGDTCSNPVATGSCSLTSTVASAKTITATYAGDTSFNTSVSPGVAHTVTQVPSILTGSSASFSLNVAGTFTFQALGFPTPTWSETGALPPGVTLSSAGVLSGTPTALGTYPIVVTATNGDPPDATQNFTLTVSNAATYVQPFNTGHGWTYTQTSCSVGFLGSCSNNVNDTAAADCQTQPCVQASVAAGFSTGAQAGYFHNTYTWNQLGIPRGATVVSVDGGFWDKASGCTGTAGVEIYDSTNTNSVAGVINTASISSDTAGVTHGLTGSPQSVLAAYQAASTTLTLRFDLNPAAAFLGTCNLNGDNFTLAISFIALNGHQVIVATNIDRDGNILSSRIVHDEPSFSDRKTK